MKLLLIRTSIGIAAGMVLLAGILYLDYQRFLQAPLSGIDAPVQYDVTPGGGLITVARELEGLGHLERPRYLIWHARLRGRADSIQAGEYLLTPGMTPAELLRMLETGDVIRYALTIPEGWTFRQMLQAIRGHDKVRQTLGDADDDAVMAAIGAPGEHPEGRFFPDTYHFVAGTPDITLLRRAYQAMEQQLAQEWEQRSVGLPFETPYEALILASIIEKETGAPEERHRIAGVFIRRLETNMRLQTDPTVIYGLGDQYGGRITRNNLRTDTPYNTYTRHGLPPTPIALPGAASLHAALHPEPGEELFFVSRGDGTHYFSVTHDEHQRAVRKYILGEQP
jgi:UPF0755 protein